MWPMILAFGSKHIVKIALVVGAIVLILGAYGKGYYKGKHNCEAAVAQAVAEELVKRDAAVEAERAKIKKLQDQIRRSRQTDPINDKRDSCILSGNPYKDDCLKAK